MRLNPLHPSDNPMEEMLFCFGGPSDSDTGGPSTQDAQMNELDQISADFENMSQQQAAGQSVTSGMSGGVGRGGSLNDNDGDGIPNSIDATPGVDRSGFGSPSQSVADSYDQAVGSIAAGVNVFDPGGAAGRGFGPIGYGPGPSIGPAEGPALGAGSAGTTAKQTEAEAAAAKAGVPSDVFVTNNGNIVRSRDGTPVTSSRSVQEAAKAAGTDTSSIMDAIRGAAGTDFGEGFGTTPGSRAADQGPQGTAITQAALEPAKVEAARQVTPGLTPEVAQIASGILDQAVPGRVAEGVRADPVMGGSLFMDDIDVFEPSNVLEGGLQPQAQPGTPAEQVLSQVSKEVELETGVPAQEVAGIIGLTGPAVSTSRTPQELALTGSQTFDVQPSVQGTFDPRISAGVMSDSPQQFDLEQMQLANDLIARSTAAANRTPVTLDRAMQKDREGYFSPGEYEIADTNQFQEQPEDEAIYGGRGIATPQAATLTDAERMSQQGVDAEMTGIPIGATAERREIAGQDPRAPDYTLAEAQANLEAARAEAYRDKQFGFDTGLPGSIDVFGAKIPTGVGVLEGVADALFNPDAALANAIAERGIRTIDGSPVPEGTANYNPQGLDVVTAGGPIGEGGRTAAYDARGNVVYDSAGMMDRIGDIFTGGTPENIEELYARQRTIDEQQREMQGGDGGQQILPPPVEQPPEAPVVDDQGRVLVQPYQYQQRGPISYAYTGLPSLAPTRLRPSYQASKRFSPLFPVS